MTLPAVAFQSEASARRLVAAADKLLGYPRQHDASEVVRVGGGIHAEVVVTETCSRVVRSGGSWAVIWTDELDAIKGKQSSVPGGPPDFVIIPNGPNAAYDDSDV